ncbi:tetratricopeptide repeat 28-like, partial [Paramuricea clavata]
SAFHELLSKGSNAFSKDDLTTAELHYSTALKLVYQGAKKEEVRICFEELGNIYVEYGKRSKCGEDFTKATALYNAALTRLTSTEAKLRQHLISRIKEAERHFLSSVLQEDSPVDLPNYDNDMKHKALLEKIRDDCKEVIVQVDFECDPGLMPLNPEERVALEKRRTNLISTLFRKISEDMTNFIRMLIEECTLVLGNAPCRFAVIGLGSLARNEMTPYSDLEFAILLEEGAKTESNLVYFRNITRYLHLKVLNLGETILPSMSITSLNDFYSGDPSRMWFFDDGPKGFSFDGAMPWASKSPFGRDEELVKVYNVKVKERLQAPSGEDMWTNGSKRGFECLNETFQDFSINLDWHEAGKVFNVKKELYRFPSLVLNSLTLYYNLDTRNTWDVVEEMQGKQLIREDEARNLSFVLAVASEFRLRSYLGKDEQRERMTGLPSEIMEPDLAKSVTAKAGPRTKLDKVFHIPNPDIVFRFFMTVLPLQKAIEEFLFKKSPKEVNILSNHNLYDGR